MPRPKGSKNKVTPISKDPIVVPLVKEPETIIVPRGTICQCGHDQDLHYGGEKGNCNRMNCRCLYFQ